MGVPLNGYRTTRLLRSSAHARVFEAIRESDGSGVVAKVFDLDGDDVEARVEHEFALIEALDIPGVVKALALQRVGDQLVLLLERVPGQNLAEYAQRQPLELDRFFSIATQITDVLASIHARRIIHRDIKPANLLIDDHGRVFIADFGISVLLDAERRHIYDPAVLEGTLPYVSPEQTGRTGRAVDFRSDLYSLGVTFYELLCGQRPFEFSAPLELIHAQLARSPDPPSSVRPDLPEGLSRLVMRLLEKAPEHRYQTASGLAADLRKLQELVELGEDGRGLMLGREDFPRSLQLPHQLYGRTNERHQLLDELERVMRTGVGRLMLLAGPPGIGKSALLADFEGPVAGFGGYLARGKFDAFCEAPYTGFVDAFTTLVEQILTESEERLTRWRERLLAALGGVGRVVCELVPKLELVIGKQPAVPELEPHEARNRLHLAVGRFLSAFCEDQQPLVVVLDDLHWAERSSFVLLRSLIEGGRHGALLLLGSYRERELSEGHPLRALIDALGDQHRVKIMRLRALDDEALEQLLSDTFARPSAEVRRLAQIISRKTDNNPLFVRQFLAHVAEQGLLRPGQHGWTWDDAALEAATIPDDVLEVMTTKLAQLAAPQRQLLAEAACIGARFDLAALEVVNPNAHGELAPMVYELVELGLLAPIGREYRFTHDRIQEVARSSLSAEQCRRIHWAIGRHELARGHTVADEHLFGLVDHLDAGISEAELDEPTRLELAQLNLRAGTRALDAAAYDAALRYLDCGEMLVEIWREAVATGGSQAPHYQLLVQLHFARAQVLALVSRKAEATAAFEQLLGWKLDAVDFGHVAARRVRLLTLEDRPTEAVEVGLAALARCGHVVERHPRRLRVRLTLMRAWLSMRGRTLEDLLAIQPCRDPSITAVMEIATATTFAAYVVDSNLLITLIGLHIRLLLQHGVHTHSALALAQLAMGVGPGLGKLDEALRLCELALELVERPDMASVRAPVEAGVYLFVWHLRRPFAEPIARLDAAYERALERGDFEYAGIMGALGLGMHIDVGTHLRMVERRSRRLEDDLGRWGSSEMVVVAWMVRGFAVTLAGRDLGDADDSDVHTSLEPEIVAARGGSRVSVYAARVNQAMLRLLLGDADAALELTLPLIDDIEKVMFGSWMVPRAALINVVAGGRVIAARHSVPPRVVEQMRKALELIRRWARGCPENYAHHRALAEGVFAVIRGRPNRAMRAFEQARVHAGAQGCRWIEGLAGELLGELAVQEGLLAFAVGARAQAYAAYEAWGAGAKLAQLRAAFPELDTRRDREDSRAHAARSGPQRSSGERSSPRSTATSSEALDFESVLQAVRAMSEDLRLDEVVGRVLEAAIANAGADRGMLLLERDGILVIVAEASVGGPCEVYDEPVRLSAAELVCPTSLVNFVVRTEQALVIDDARTDPRFSSDPYVVRTGVLSLLAMPIVKGKRALGALVLENRLSAYCFTPERLEGLGLIAGQAASALDNARLYTALRRSEARWRSLVDGAPDLIALLNERGEVEFVNHSSLVGLGGEGGGGGRLLEMFLSSASADEWRDAVSSVLRDGHQRELEIELVREHEPSRWFVARLAPIEVEAEAGVGVSTRHAVAVATDITARKQAEVERQELEAQLRQQQRLESVGTLASGVAHEINNPVQGILNYAELISESLDNREVVREFAQEITTESNRVAAIVRNLLQFSRQERDARTEDADVATMIEGTMSLIRAVLRKDHIKLIIEIPEGLPKIRCRVQQIQQIIMNLVTNARDALNEVYPRFDERKVIEIRAELLPRKPRELQRVRITVEDHGPGIPADVLPRIFDPFFTTKGRDQGTGLGLSVSHGIAQDHGGELSVETKRGEWTRFCLDLPATGG